MNIDQIINNSLKQNKFIYAVFTTPRNKQEDQYKRITARPVRIKGESMVQFERFTDKQAFHENMVYESAKSVITDLIKSGYRNINLFTADYDYQFMVSKKGSIKVTEKEPSKKVQTIEHNKKKQYIINEDEPCDFLNLLEVMNEDGRVYAQKYDKFKQINKFLEIVDDAVRDKDIRDDFMIIDFGCGKAYLTFALYYYFYNIKKAKVKIIGLDLKEDVIKFCGETAEKLHYDNLEFRFGDIKDFEYKSSVDMVVTLHACDNATDAALVKAIKWNTDIILSVPCCQHEFFDKIENRQLEPMLRHGIVKERVSSLVTDSLRCLFLEKYGYNVQLLEFISMEHTPKNILIRALKTNKENKQVQEQYEEFKKFWHLNDLFIENYYNKQ